MSEIKYINGKYHKDCFFHLCNGTAIGRKDKLFCKNQCKNAFHNEINSKIYKLAKGLPAKIIKANKILWTIYQVNEKKGGFITTQIDLSNRNFPFDLPTSLMKDDRYTYDFHKFGSFAFCKLNDKYLFIKIKKQEI